MDKRAQKSYTRNQFFLSYFKRARSEHEEEVTRYKKKYIREASFSLLSTERRPKKERIIRYGEGALSSRELLAEKNMRRIYKVKKLAKDTAKVKELQKMCFTELEIQ